MTTINSHSLPLDVVAQVLAESLPYIKRFHGKTIVVKYGGNAMTEEVLQRSFAHDVVLLKLFGLNPVVVHGGGPQIDDALKRIGKQGTFIQGMRVTDEDTMEVVEWVLGGQVQQDIVLMINEAGGKAVGLTGKDGSMIQAVKKLMPNKEDPSLPIDIGYVGDIAKIEPALVKALQDDQFIPVISPIGYGEDGLAYNINADVVVETGKFDADGARAQHQQLGWQFLGGHRVAIGPDPLAVGLGFGQVARTRARCYDNVLGGQFGGFPVLGGNGDLAGRDDLAGAHVHRDLVLFHQVSNALIELLGHPARALHDGAQIRLVVVD